MKQRVRELGGSLRLENTHPGTLVEIVIPHRSVELADRAKQAVAPLA
jgi:signal transduction histidine kinase